MTDDATTLSAEAEKKAEGLAANTKQIGEIAGLIASIADQTNLLALNATIEAARAGEAGRGFAVVAQEVKALATQTGKATEEIDRQVTAIREASIQMVKAVHDITQTIGNITGITTSIAGAIEQQNAATAQISESLERASSGTAQVTQFGVRDAEGRGRDRRRRRAPRRAGAGPRGGCRQPAALGRFAADQARGVTVSARAAAASKR